MIELPLLEPQGIARYWDDPAAWHVFESDGRPFIYVADGSRVFELDYESRRQLDETQPHERLPERLEALGIRHREYVNDDPPENPLPRSLSLAIAQKCNLACTYCYAQEGTFGGQAKAMSRDVAFGAVDFLLKQASAGDRVNLAFLGGEPLLAREALYDTVAYANQEATARKVTIGFSITTNGTLITRRDGEFFERHGFAVTVSLDGNATVHDRQRAYKGGGGSHEQIISRIVPLLEMQHRMQVSARVTVTPRNLTLPETLNSLISLGFHSVGFSPMLASPTGRDEMDNNDLIVMLDQMISCGREFERRVAAGNRYPFSNMYTAMREIHRGTHRPYPCGAGAGYLGVSADGELAACHRFVGDPYATLGDIANGLHATRQSTWLADRHLHRQQPCQSCWARYLCGGGCHYDVFQKGRFACNYVRGWLHYCLEAYCRLLISVPDYFSRSEA